MGRTISIQEQEERRLLRGKGHTFNNPDYITECFASIKERDPVRVDVAVHSDGEHAPITCLEHILNDIYETGDAVGGKKSEASINPMFFDFLADPELDLEQPLCTIYDTTDHEWLYGDEQSCLTRIFESYAALRQYKRPISLPDGSKPESKVPYNDEAYNRVVAEIRSITRRYPQYLKKGCRARKSESIMTCLDAIIGQSNNWRVLDLNAIPTDVFSDTSCGMPIDGRRDLIPCYEFIIRQALMNNSHHHSVQTAYANTLLANMMSRNKFDDDLLKSPDMCAGGNFQSCFDYMLNNMAGSERSPYNAVNAVITRYSKDGEVDTNSPDSIFSGEKCTHTDKSHDVTINCFDLILSRALDVVPKNMEKLSEKATLSESRSFQTILKMALEDTRYLNSPCKLLDIISDSYSINPSMHRKMMINSQIIRILGLQQGRPLTRGELYKAIRQSSTMMCMVDANGNGVSFLDYMTDRPMIMDLISDYVNRSNEIILAMNSEECTTEHGVKQNCIAKIIDKLFREGDNTYAKVVNSFADRISNFYVDGEGIELAHDIVPEPDRTDLYSMDQSIKIRTGDKVTPFNNYLMGEMLDVLDGMNDDEFGHSYDSMIKIYNTTLSKGQEMDFMLVDSITSRFSQFGHTKCDTYVQYLMHAQNNGYGTQNDYKDLLNGTKVMFSPAKCMESAIPFLKEVYIDGDDEIKEIIKTKFSPKIENAAIDADLIDPSFRYRAEMYLHTRYPEDPRYRKEPIGGTTTDAKTEFYYFLNPDKAKEIGINEIQYEPSPLERWNYDSSCMRDMNAGKQYKGDNAFVEEVLSDPKFATTMREDEFGITGSYEVYVDSTIWTEDRRNRYGGALLALIYGRGGYVGSPYVPKGRYREGDRVKIDTGIIDAFREIMKSEPVGQRAENRTATPRITFTPNLSGEYDLDKVLNRSGNDIAVTTEYIDDQTGKPIERMTKTYKFMDILKNLPKKFITNMQKPDKDGGNEKYRQLFGLVQLVVTYEAEKSKGGVDTYMMNISNRPIDILRISTGHKWDSSSCMKFGDNPQYNRHPDTGHNTAVHGYVDYRSYVAYLTKDSPYEPKWYARMQMHRCHSGDTPLISVQHGSSGYDVGGNYHTYWDILNDAVHVAFAEKEINQKCTGRCTHYWAGMKDKNGKHYNDYTDNGGRCYTYSLKSNEVTGILRARTKQTEDPSKFVKQVSTTF